MRTRRTAIAPWGVLALCIAAYVAWVAAFSTNVPFSDGWTLVPLLRAAQTRHGFWIRAWRQHNENRMIVPKVLLTGLGLLTHDNVRGDMLLSSACVAGLVLLLARQWAQSGRSAWTFLPGAVVLLDPIQAGDALWGFQCAWYLVALCGVGAIVTLTRQAERPSAGWIVAPILAVAASFSSSQGLLLWPVGAVWIAWQALSPRAARWRWIGAAWSGTGLATLGAYLWHFRWNDLGNTAAAVPGWHPERALESALVVLGNVSGYGAAPHGVTVCAVVGGVLAVWTVFTVCRVRRQAFDAVQVTAALMVGFGFGFVAMVTAGRAGFGVHEALASRYALYDLWIVAGLTWLALASPPGRAVASLAAGGGIPGARRTARLRALAVLLWETQVVVTLTIGVLQGVATHRECATLVAAVRAETVRPLPAALVARDIFPKVARWRRAVRIAERQHWSLFAEPPALPPARPKA